MVVMTDDNPNPLFQPTKQNMMQAMSWLASCNNYGDSLFFHFSGHGGQRQDASGDESDGMDETILPVDYHAVGHITDDEMNKLMVRPLPHGVRLTAVFDCCHSGSSLDLPYTYNPDGSIKVTPPAVKVQNAIQGLMTGNLGALAALAGGQQSMSQKEYAKGNPVADVIMFSGCKGIVM